MCSWSLSVLRCCRWIDLAHKSHNAPFTYPTMHRFLTETCIWAHSEICEMGYQFVTYSRQVLASFRRYSFSGTGETIAWLSECQRSTPKGTFTLCPSPCPSPCPYQSPCPNNSHFLMKLEAVFRLHQFPYQSPIQCHQISVRSVSIGPPTVKNWYGRPFPSESCKSLYKITLWRLARQLWTWN